MSLLELTGPDTLASSSGWLPPASLGGTNKHTNKQLLLAPHMMLANDEIPNRRIYRVVDGCVALCQLLSDGRRQIIDIVGPGRLFGFGGRGAMSCMAQSLTYTSLEAVPEPLSRDVLDDEMLTFLDRIRNHMTLLGRKNAREKVATAVLDLLDQFAGKPGVGKKQPMTFNLYLTREDLADWLGLTFETVSRCLNQMKREGIIDFRQAEIITVLDMPRLRVTACLPAQADDLPAARYPAMERRPIAADRHMDSNHH